MSESLYFIAILPPQEIQDEITAFKNEIAQKFDSKHALNSPPHITLHMPFKWKDKKFDQLQEVIRSINDRLVPFKIELYDFDFFEPRVVFVNVIGTEELDNLQKTVITACRKELKLDNGNYKDRPFHPHVTVGFRDLRKARFYEAKSEFENRKVYFEFMTSEITLLKHDGKQWKVV